MVDLQKQIDETPKEVIEAVLKVAETKFAEEFMKAKLTFMMEQIIKEQVQI